MFSGIDVFLANSTANVVTYSFSRTSVAPIANCGRGPVWINVPAEDCDGFGSCVRCCALCISDHCRCWSRSRFTPLCNDWCISFFAFMYSIYCMWLGKWTDTSSMLAGLLLAQRHSYSILVHSTKTVSRLRHEKCILQLPFRYRYFRWFNSTNDVPSGLWQFCLKCVSML